MAITSKSYLSLSERLESSGNKVIPYRNSLPEMSYAVLPSTGDLIIITKGEKGYTNVSNAYDSPERNKELANEHNAKMGVTKAQAEAMLVGSMFGWEVPAADPKNYDVAGKLIKPRNIERGDAR